MEIYRSLLPASRETPDLHLFTNLMGVSNVEVNTLQRLAAVGVQKSLREGFGLVVSETLLEGHAMVERARAASHFRSRTGSAASW